ncbi:MAG: hypothetical protein ACXADW_24710 [Candidatus Hodarchaeales archaeon]|jgi:hypothetical protein
MPIDEIKVEHINQFKKVVSISYKKKRQIDQYEPLELGYFVSQELNVEEDHKPIAEQLYNDASSFVLDKLYPENQKAEKSVNGVKGRERPRGNPPGETGDVGSIPTPDSKADTINRGKPYQWFKTSEGDKVRLCNNAPCPYYLKWNSEQKTYEHGKYDHNTKRWVFVDDRCEYYGGG